MVPLAGWSRAQVWDYLRAHGIDHHPLYDRGIRRSAALRAPVPPSPGRASVPGAGGGKGTPTRSASCIRRSRPGSRPACAAVRSAPRWEQRAQLRGHEHRDCVPRVIDEARLLSRGDGAPDDAEREPGRDLGERVGLDLGGVGSGDLTERLAADQIGPICCQVSLVSVVKKSKTWDASFLSWPGPQGRRQASSDDAAVEAVESDAVCAGGAAAAAWSTATTVPRADDGRAEHGDDGICWAEQRVHDGVPRGVRLVAHSVVRIKRPRAGQRGVAPVALLICGRLHADLAPLGLFCV